MIHQQREVFKDLGDHINILITKMWESCTLGTGDQRNHRCPLRLIDYEFWQYRRDLLQFEFLYQLVRFLNFQTEF